MRWTQILPINSGTDLLNMNVYRSTNRKYEDQVELVVGRYMLKLPKRMTM